MKLPGFSLLTVFTLAACHHAAPLVTTTVTVSASPPVVVVGTTTEPEAEAPEVTARVVPTECTEAAHRVTRVALAR